MAAINAPARISFLTLPPAADRIVRVLICDPLRGSAFDWVEYSDAKSWLASDT